LATSAINVTRTTATATRPSDVHDKEPGMPRENTEITENEQPALIADALVEEVSIDGMCGVY
jgi:mycofactocin precursor